MVDFEKKEDDSVPKEIERKFLIGTVPENVYDGSECTFIRQGYLEINPDGSELRIRERNGLYYLTHKVGTGLIRGETEETISEGEFMSQWGKTEGKRVEKHRYTVPYQDVTIELDEYHGELQGLIVAEVEFPDEAAAHSFEVPEWFGAEVTDDKRYKNQQLALNGMPSG